MSIEKRNFGFSEEAMRSLEEFESRQPPPEAQLERPDVNYARPFLPNRNVPASGRPHYWGHRERLRQRFLSGGHKSMPEYELLELILFNAIPRIDVKPLAKQLLEVFGDLNGVIAASEHRLLKVPGTTQKVYIQLKLAEAVSHRMAQAKVMQRSALHSWDDLMTYCKTTMAYRETEQFRILFLDPKNTVIADEEQARGTVNHVPVYPREVAKRCLEINASALILVHNHPSGDPTPSRADIDMTEQIAQACEAIGVRVHDHVIIGKEEDASFRSLGLLN
ncbi:RadC family protein [Amaricoccus tamworthensis]|uniref:RadC family protein n=1 Tax=Amaricoccus tamworthensis TaxID=57002 RepID=UPI003C7A63E0